MNNASGTGRRIPAFTLIELIIAMALTAVVIAIGFATFRFATSNFSRLSVQLAEQVQYTQLMHVMKQDVKKATEVRFREAGFGCVGQDQILEVSYLFADSVILRVTETLNLPPDSFFFSVDSVSMYFQGKPVSVNEQLIDALQLSVGSTGKNMQFTIDKTYDAQTLVRAQLTY